jgi:periodic tryptophan protein 2
MQHFTAPKRLFSNAAVFALHFSHSSHTLPFETRKDITRLAVSPDGVLLLVVDEDGHATLVNLIKRVVLAAFNFKEKVYAISFSPNGKYFAVNHGKLIHIWKTPGVQKEFAPFVFHREIPGHFDRVTCIEWSDDSRWILSGSRDLTVQLHPAKLAKKTGGPTDKGARPFTLAGHKDYVVRAMFGKQASTVYTVSKDGSLFIWKWEPAEPTSETKKRKTSDDGNDSAEGSDSEDNTPVSTDIFMNKTYRWRLQARHYFNQNSKVHSARFHKASNLLVIGFANGFVAVPDFVRWCLCAYFCFDLESLDCMTFQWASSQTSRS